VSPRTEGETFFTGPDDGSASGPDPAEDTVRLNPWELPGAASHQPAPAETFFEPTTSQASPGAHSGFRPSGSSVDLDAIPASSVPVLRVPETGSLVVTSEEAPPPAEPAGNVSIPPSTMEGPGAPPPPAVDAPVTIVPPVGDPVLVAADNARSPEPE